MTTPFILAIDQGTTNSRAIVFNRQGDLVSQYALPLKQYFPHDGWVEQDPQEFFQNTITCCRKAIEAAALQPKDIATIGLTNQRETTIIWDKKNGKPIYPAIVWQDRRTSDYCKALAQTAISQQIQTKTGLLLDPYFSATKIVWLLDHIAGARERAERGELLFGTVDTFLLWKLTNGQSHLTDATNASRTLLFNIHTQEWDEDILSALHIPKSMLPQVVDNTADFGRLDQSILGAQLTITGMAGDQQAATVGQACFHPGMVKVTYGTGCFMLLNTGNQVIHSNHRLLSTIAYRINNKVTYGLEGSIFSAGVTVKWLRDTVKMITTAEETESLARSVKNTGGVYLLPAFTGLGAPYWAPHARAAIVGITRNSDRAQIVRAALESVGYQTRDLLDAMMQDSGKALEVLRVDGGMTNNQWLLQFLADVLNLEVQRPVCIETSALGAAYLAGLHIGLYQSLDEIAKLWQMKASYQPKMAAAEREALYAGWKQALKQIL